MSTFSFSFRIEKRAARRQFVGAVSRLQHPLSIKKRKKSERLNGIVKSMHGRAIQKAAQRVRLFVWVKVYGFYYLNPPAALLRYLRPRAKTIKSGEISLA